MEEERRGYVTIGSCYGCIHTADNGGVVGTCREGQEVNCPNVVEVTERKCSKCGEWIPPHEVENAEGFAFIDNGYIMRNGSPVCGNCYRGYYRGHERRRLF